MQRGLEIEVVCTPIFRKIVDYIRKHPGGNDSSQSQLNQLSRRLFDTGYYMEAGTLNLECNNVHPLLLNASNAVSFLQRTKNG